jgi:hypothetical protein
VHSVKSFYVELKPIGDKRQKEKREENREEQKSRSRPSPSRTKHVAPATGNLFARNDAEGASAEPAGTGHTESHALVASSRILMSATTTSQSVPHLLAASKARELACCRSGIGRPVAAAPPPPPAGLQPPGPCARRSSILLTQISLLELANLIVRLPCLCLALLRAEHCVVCA